MKIIIAIFLTLLIYTSNTYSNSEYEWSYKVDRTKYGVPRDIARVRHKKYTNDDPMKGVAVICMNRPKNKKLLVIISHRNIKLNGLINKSAQIDYEIDNYKRTDEKWYINLTSSHHIPFQSGEKAYEIANMLSTAKNIKFRLRLKGDLYEEYSFNPDHSGAIKKILNKCGY